MMEDGQRRSWLPKVFKSNAGNKNDTGGTREANETSSLLPSKRNGSVSPDQEEGEIEDYDEEKPTHKAIITEFKILLKGSIPVILAYALQNSLQTISVVIVGRGSPQDLATAAFAYMFAMSTAWLIALGGTTALDTLCSSSFTGSKNPHDLGILLQRAFIVLGLFYIPVCILWFCSEPLFQALGEGDQLSRDSARFLMALIPGGLGYIYFEAMKKYLQAQGSSLPSELWTVAHTSRNHAPRNLRPFNNISSQCRSELAIRLHIQNWSSRSPHCDRYIILAVLSWPRGIHQVRRRIGMLGRLVSQVSVQHGHLCTFGRAWSSPCWNRVVGL